MYHLYSYLQCWGEYIFDKYYGIKISVKKINRRKSRGEVDLFEVCAFLCALVYSIMTTLTTHHPPPVFVVFITPRVRSSLIIVSHDSIPKKKMIDMNGGGKIYERMGSMSSERKHLQVISRFTKS